MRPSNLSLLAELKFQCNYSAIVMEYVYDTYNAELIIHTFAFIACNDTLCTTNLESYTACICLCSLEPP